MEIQKKHRTINKDHDQVLKDINKNSIKAIEGISRKLKEVLVSIPRLEFPEFDYLPAVKIATEEISRLDSCFTELSLFLPAAVVEMRKFFEEREKAFAPIIRQLEVVNKLSLIGERGWTTLPGTIFESYMDCPVDNQEETDSYFMKLLKEDVVETLFTEIVSISDNDILDDVLEAINNYREGRYKSSVLVLFSLIDGILIRNQKGKVLETFKQTDQYKRSKNRPVGEVAANNITEYFGQAPASFHFYHYVVLKSCLPKLFVKAKDFSIPEHPINRNMVSHGMLKRKVEKKDCLQLFLLFRNFIKYIIDFNVKFGSDQGSE